MRYIKVNNEMYCYCIIRDDTGSRVEIRPATSLSNGNEQILIRKYIDTHIGKYELEQNIISWISEYQKNR